MPDMPAFRLIQISDTHLSREKSWFLPNFSAALQTIAARQPDLVVNTGDIALDGAGREDDLIFARRAHDGLAVPLRCIPGNHDLGDNPWRAGVDPAISGERLQRYRKHFGADYWSLELGPWHLIGLNVQLFGSGLAEEGEQWQFLTSAASAAAGRPTALFVHKPLFKDYAGETDVDHRYVNPAHRHRLLQSLAATDLRLVASGHVHQHRHRRVGAVHHCWGPSTAFVLPDRRQPQIGVKRVGFIEYRLAADGVEIEIIEAPELVNNNIDDFPAAYDH